MASPFYTPPINYALNVASPFEQAVQGLKLGATVADMEAQRQQAQLKAQQQQQLMEQQRLAAAEQQRFFGLENPTIKDLMRYSAYIPPEQANAMRQQFELLGRDRAQANLTRGAQVLSTIVAGRPDLSIALLEESRDATQDPAEKKALQTYIDIGKADPSTLFKAISVPMMTSEEGRKLIAGIESSQAAARAEAKGIPELARLQAEAEAAQIGLKTLAEEKRVALGAARSDADRKAIQAEFERRQQEADLRAKNADIALKNAQAEKARRPDAEGKASSGPPVAVVDPATGKIVYVSREEAIEQRLTPAASTEGLSPKEIQNRNAKFPQATAAVKTFESSTDTLIKDLRTLQSHPGLDSITGIAAGRVPGITASGRAAEALYDKIIARGGFQELQNMRNASPTGGALGNVSNQEGAQLRQAFAAIDRRQNAVDVRKAIDDAITNLEGSKSRVREAYDSTYEYKTGGTPAGASGQWTVVK